MLETARLRRLSITLSYFCLFHVTIYEISNTSYSFLKHESTYTFSKYSPDKTIRIVFRRFEVNHKNSTDRIRSNVKRLPEFQIYIFSRILQKIIYILIRLSRRIDILLKTHNLPPSHQQKLTPQRRDAVARNFNFST